jgi:integrase
MANIAKREDGRYRARYRDAAGKEHSKHFTRKQDAQRWLNDVTAAVVTGTYVDPRRGRVTVGEWARTWLDGRADLKPSTRERYEGILRTHVLPRWSDVRLTDVGHADVQAWVTGLTKGSQPASVRKTHRVISMLLDAAVRDGRLSRNPASGLSLPRVVAPERMYLSHEQVHALVAAIRTTEDAWHHPVKGRDGYALAVLFLAYTGVRFGEMAALRVNRLDLIRRRAQVAESVTEVSGRQVWGTPKGHERRAVPIPRFLVEELRQHIAGMAGRDLVFTGVRSDRPLRIRILRRAALDEAAAKVGVGGLHPHALRHTAASLAIASGANVKVVQQMLGHKSATMTLDLYGHLFGDDLDQVADRLDAAVASWR